MGFCNFFITIIIKSAGTVPALGRILLKSAGSVAKLGLRPNIQYYVVYMRDGNETNIFNIYFFFNIFYKVNNILFYFQYFLE